ncbi:MAG: glycosyltransferase family 2 protein [Planctomycetes bacterium]|nr:glycosyltransferase family 2 protein [Planctomycetota bacterium]
MDAAALSRHSIGVVIPAYRVARQIEQVVRGIPPFVRSIIVVVDASPDDSYERVAAMRDPRVTLIRHESNQGVGGAMQSGFRAALDQGLDIVVKMDGDDQMDPAEMPRLLEPLILGQADVTKGNRYEHVSALKSMPAIRILGNAGLTFLVKLASGYWNLFDPANGYVALRTDVLRRLDIAKLHKRYFFESGFLIQLGIMRAVVKDVAIPARYGNEQSSLSITRTLFGFPPKLLWGFVRRIFWRHFVYDFTALSLYLLLALPALSWGVIYGTVVWLEVLETHKDATAGQVMLSAMPIILGVQMLTQCFAFDIQNVPRQPLGGPLAPRDDPRA